MLPTYSLSAGLLVWDTTGTDWNATVYKTEHLWTNPTLLLLSSLPSSSTISRSVWDKEKERRLSASEPPNHQKLNWEFGFEALRFLLGLEAAAQTCWGTQKWGKSADTWAKGKASLALNEPHFNMDFVILFHLWNFPNDKHRSSPIVNCEWSTTEISCTAWP